MVKFSPVKKYKLLIEYFNLFQNKNQCKIEAAMWFNGKCGNNLERKSKWQMNF